MNAPPRSAGFSRHSLQGRLKPTLRQQEATP